MGGYTTSKETQQRGKPLNIPSQSYVSVFLSLFARFARKVELFAYALLLEGKCYQVPFWPGHISTWLQFLQKTDSSPSCFLAWLYAGEMCFCWDKHHDGLRTNILHRKGYKLCPNNHADELCHSNLRENRIIFMSIPTYAESSCGTTSLRHTCSHLIYSLQKPRHTWQWSGSSVNKSRQVSSVHTGCYNWQCRVKQQKKSMCVLIEKAALAKFLLPTQG